MFSSKNFKRILNELSSAKGTRNTSLQSKGGALFSSFWYQDNNLGVNPSSTAAYTIYQNHSLCAESIAPYFSSRGLKAVDIEDELRILRMSSCLRGDAIDRLNIQLPKLTEERLADLTGMVDYCKDIGCIKVIPEYLQSLYPSHPDVQSIEDSVVAYYTDNSLSSWYHSALTALRLCGHYDPFYCDDPLPGIVDWTIYILDWALLVAQIFMLYRYLAALGVRLAGEAAVAIASALSMPERVELDKKMLRDAMGTILFNAGLIDSNTPENVRAYLIQQYNMDILHESSLLCPGPSPDPYPELDDELSEIESGPPPSGVPGGSNEVPTSPTVPAPPGR